MNKTGAELFTTKLIYNLKQSNSIIDLNIKQQTYSLNN